MKRAAQQGSIQTALIIALKIKITQISLLTENISPLTILDPNSLSVNVNYKKFPEVNQFNVTFKSILANYINNIRW